MKPQHSEKCNRLRKMGKSDPFCKYDELQVAWMLKHANAETSAGVIIDAVIIEGQADLEKASDMLLYIKSPYIGGAAKFTSGIRVNRTRDKNRNPYRLPVGKEMTITCCAADQKYCPPCERAKIQKETRPDFLAQCVNEYHGAAIENLTLIRTDPFVELMQGMGLDILADRYNRTGEEWQEAVAKYGFVAIRLPLVSYHARGAIEWMVDDHSYMEDIIRGERQTTASLYAHHNPSKRLPTCGPEAGERLYVPPEKTRQGSLWALTSREH